MKDMKDCIVGPGVAHVTDERGVCRVCGYKEVSIRKGKSS